MKEGHYIIIIHVIDRMKAAVDVQKALTKFGKSIKTRLGVHDVGGDKEADGLIFLEVKGSSGEGNKMKSDLEVIDGIEVRSVEFSH